MLKPERELAKSLSVSDLAIWILAHPDDEILGLPLFGTANKHLLVYLTDGLGTNISDHLYPYRSSEIQKVEQYIESVLPANVLNLGQKISLRDSHLHSDWNPTFDEMIMEAIKICNPESKFVRIFSTRFEGAHQDHDSAATIAFRIGSKLNYPVYFFPTYPMHNRLKFFTLNPSLSKSIFVRFNRLWTIRLSLHLIKKYPSQILTWIFLGPPLIWKYLFKDFYISSEFQLQPIERCLYEFRGRATQVEVLQFLNYLLDEGSPEQKRQS